MCPQIVVHVIDRAVIGKVFQDGGRRSAIKRLKRGHISRSMICSIVLVFSPRKEWEPFARLLIHKIMQVLLIAPVNHLRLAVGLRIIGETHLTLCAWHLGEFLPKSAKKYRISIQNNRPGHAMKLHNIFNKFLCYRLCCIWMSQCHKMSRFA